MERGEDGAAEEVLDGDRLHVGGRVVRADAEAVDRDRRHEDRERPVAGGRETDQGGAHREQDEGRAHGGRAVAPPGQRLGEDRPGPGEEDEQEHEPGEGELAELELRLELGEPQGQGDEEQALDGEGAGGGEAVGAHAGRRGGGRRAHPAIVAVGSPGGKVPRGPGAPHGSPVVHRVVTRASRRPRGPDTAVPLAVAVSEARPGFRPDVEGLRATAVLLVVAYHVWLGRVSGGVDVFLLLSAYFLVGGLVRRLERGEQVSVPRQWLRVFQRLVPAAAVTVAATVVAGLVFLPQPRWRGLLVDAVGSLTYTENWVLASRAVDYYAADKGQASPLQHMWSLSVQGQAFLLVPVLVVGAGWVARRRGWSPSLVVGVVLGAAVVGSLAWSVHTTATRQAFAYFDSASRVWELALGGLLAVVLPRVRVPRAVAQPLGWAGLLALVACGMVLDVTRSFPGWVALWPLACAGAILAAGAVPTRWGVDRLLSTRPLVTAGGSAYALYLVHWPVLVLWLATSGRPRAGLLDGAVVVAASLVLAQVLTRVVERPVRRLDWPVTAPWRSAGVVVGSAALVAGLAAGGVLRLDHDARRGDRLSAGHEVSGYPGARALSGSGTARVLPVDQRLPASTALRREFASLPGPCSGGWAAPAAFADTCTALEPDGEARATVLVVGDSHAEQWLAAVTPLAEREGWRVVALLEGGCSFGAASTRTGACARWNTAALDYVTSHRADLLVTVATAAHPRTPTERLVTGYEEVIRTVTGHGTPVVGLRDNPRFTSGVVACALERGDEACTAPVSEKLAATNPAAAVTAPGYSTIDLTDLVCPDGRCPPAVGNVWVYLDDNHLTRSYAATLAPALEERLRAVGAWPGDGRVVEAGATLSR